MKRKKVSYMLATGVAVGLLSGSTACEGEENTTEEDNYTFIEQDRSNDYRIKQKEEIGKQIMDILRKSGEFDKVDYELRGFDLNDSEKDLIIKSYQREREVLRLEWGLNLDHICRVTTYTGEGESSRLCTETDMAHVICGPSLERDAAKQLTEIINGYIGNNKERCKDRNRFYQNKY